MKLAIVNKQVYILVAAICCIYLQVKAQCASGSLNVCLNSTAQYTYAGSATRVNWEVVSGGSIQGNPRSKTVNILWEQGGLRRIIVQDLDDPGNDCWTDVNVRGGVGGVVTVQTVNCEIGSASLSLSGLSGGWGTIVRWESSANAQVWSPINHTSPTYSVSNLTSSTFFRAIVNDCGIDTPSSWGFVELVPKGTVSLVSGIPAFCIGESATVTIRIDNYSGTLKAWQKSEFTNGSWGGWVTAIPNPPDEVQFVVSKPTRFRGHVLTDVCGFLPTENYIEVAGTPLATAAGNLESTRSSVCSGETFSIYITGNQGSVQQWFRKDDTHNEEWWSLASPTNITINTTTSFKASVRNGACSIQETDPITVIKKSTPEINHYTDTPVCSGTQINYIPTSSLENTTYSWQASFPSDISGVPVSGTGIPLNQTIANSSSEVKRVTYTITPSKDNCTGAPKNYIVDIKPVPTVTITPGSLLGFSDQSVNASISNPNGVAGTVFSWTVINASNITGAASGNGNAIQQIVRCVNNMQEGSATYRVTPQAAGCNGQPKDVPLRVFPKPQVIFDGPGYLSYGVSTRLKVLQVYSGYQWFKDGVSIGMTQNLEINEPGSYHVRVAGTQTGPYYSSEPVSIDEAVRSQNLNYIRTTVFQREGITENANYLDIEQSDMVQSVEYFDDLGRPMQTVTLKGSPQGYDLVQPYLYDAFDRQVKKYLPFGGQQDGRYKPNEEIIDASSGEYIGIAEDFYNNPVTKIADDDNKPFSKTLFESSPLNRILKQGAPGEVWQPNEQPFSMDDNTLKKRYEVNHEHEILRFKYDISTGLLTLHKDEYYSSNQLYANKTYDEHNNEVIEYVDKEGRTVCKKVQYATEGTGSDIKKLYTETYYLYDDFGNLVVVLPPEATKELKKLYNMN